MLKRPLPASGPQDSDIAAVLIGFAFAVLPVVVWWRTHRR